jgi:hypothetical protein
MTLFSVQLELGPETRAMVERVATSATLRVEFGPKTLAMIKSLVPAETNKQEGDKGLLRKGADAALGK